MTANVVNTRQDTLEDVVHARKLVRVHQLLERKLDRLVDQTADLKVVRVIINIRNAAVVSDATKSYKESA